MKKLIFALLGAVCLSQVSCINVDMDDLDDLIRLSHHEVIFTPDDRTTVDVHTESRRWWIVEVKTNGETYRPDYGRHSDDLYDEITLRADWLTLERTGNKTLRIRVDANRSSHKRHATIVLKSAAGVEYIKVVQFPD